MIPAMFASNEQSRVKTAIPLPMDAIEAWCRKWDVTQVAVFGSILRDDFRPESDIDVIVSFSPKVLQSFRLWFEMQEEIEGILGRKVDLLDSAVVEKIRNPYLKPEIKNSARVIYAR